MRWLARQHKLLLLHARLHLLLISGLFCSTAVALCVPMGLIAWSSAGSFCITDLSLQVRKMSRFSESCLHFALKLLLQPLSLYSDAVTGMSSECL